MKKIIVLSIALLPSFVFAQFNKRQVYLGGSLSVSLFNNDIPATANSYGRSNKNNALTLSPLIGIFLNEKVAIGVGVGYNTSYNESNYTTSYFDGNSNLITVQASQKTWTNGISVTPFTRYYVPISSSFYFAAHGQISFIRANQKDVLSTGTQEITQEQPYYSVGVTLNPVFIFFPSPNWGIEASLGSVGYHYQRYLPDVSSSNNFFINAGSFSLGFAYYFAKK
jgi:hypothetical protein